MHKNHKLIDHNKVGRTDYFNWSSSLSFTFMKQFHDWYFVRTSHSWFTIYSDSVSAIQSVCNSFSTLPLVKQIHLWLTLLKKKHKHVTFCWVPSHIGVAGNEAADRAAREAHDPIHDTPLPYRDYFPYYQRRLLDGWQSEWDLAHHNNKLRSVKRSVRPWSTSSRESRRESVIITRLRIGHTRLTHGHLLVGEEAPYCEGCIVPLHSLWYTFWLSALNILSNAGSALVVLV